ncbi:MAG: methylenetetrahydrofolate--tRNA-(uracil(54)-C(5))-methyltransferase (FADH(2)-oxidizing) TrmFO [Deltaproteobacteria bacterium]|nr:methylenetetrahydrofolate--tRNA-(uracil(54)-C(5))-methyltransferase (FADH(2)-oxidizing) TrmFO [Deltaproteobacteria bacterium]
MSETFVNVIGGGLAGSELSYQLGSRGIKVRLFEMRPQKLTPAHRSGGLAELVCSNTFKSTAPHAAPGILKRELAELGSLLMQCAPLAQVPAGEALAVDREVFSREIEKLVLATGNVERISMVVEDLASLPPAHATVLATGPLTQGKLTDFVKSLSGGFGLYFYDAIAPVVDASSVDREIAFAASRYGKGGDDYLNCPMTEEEYTRFYDALMSAEKMDFQDFEEAQYFQGCQPIEASAETGKDSPRFGPMKPVGLVDPRTGRQPYAVVQLRIDNISRSAFNLVGFQTKLKYGEQKRVFQLIPGLENAEFLRLGSMHRNTYVCSPLLLDENFALRADRNVRLAGQITGVEGYTESSSIGLLLAMSLWSELTGRAWQLPPRASALGSLCHYLFNSPADEFQPVNVHFGLFDQQLFTFPKGRKGKREMRELMGVQAVANICGWRDKLGWANLSKQ